MKVAEARQQFEELEHLRTETSATFRKQNGKRLLLAGCDVAHYKKDGVWKPIDTTLALRGGRHTAENHPGRPVISKDGLSLLLPDGSVLSLMPLTSSKRRIVVPAKQSITMKNLWDGVDAEFVVTDMGLKATYTKTKHPCENPRFAVSGDLLSVFQPPFIEKDGLATTVPWSFDGGILEFFFEPLPVGAVVDPTLQVRQGSNRTTGCYGYGAYSPTPEGAYSDFLSAGTVTTYNVTSTVRIHIETRFDKGDYVCSSYWAALAFDTSALPTQYTVTAATLSLTPNGGVIAPFYLTDWLSPSSFPIGDGTDGLAIKKTQQLCSSSTSSLASPIPLTRYDTIGAVTKSGYERWTGIGVIAVPTRHSPYSGADFYIYNGNASTEAYRPLLAVEYTAGGSGGLAYPVIGSGIVNSQRIIRRSA